MTTTRLEAFSDAVIAIALTIMVLEMKAPRGTDWTALQPILPIFLSYVMSFVYLGIYWNNHHHMLHATQRINGRVLWANLHLLFWLSLVPFVTGWMSENKFAPLPTAVYGVVLLAAAIAYTILQTSITSLHNENAELREAIGKDFKGKLSIGLYALAIVLAGWKPWMAIGIYVLVALLWLVPRPPHRNENRLAGVAHISASISRLSAANQRFPPRPVLPGGSATLASLDSTLPPG